jgi:hypothetical protein
MRQPRWWEKGMPLVAFISYVAAIIIIMGKVFLDTGGIGYAVLFLVVAAIMAGES